VTEEQKRTFHDEFVMSYNLQYCICKLFMMSLKIEFELSFINLSFINLSCTTSSDL
jgi:hypothetical protein